MKMCLFVPAAAVTPFHSTLFHRITISPEGELNQLAQHSTAHPLNIYTTGSIHHHRLSAIAVLVSTNTVSHHSHSPISPRVLCLHCRRARDTVHPAAGHHFLRRAPHSADQTGRFLHEQDRHKDGAYGLKLDLIYLICPYKTAQYNVIVCVCVAVF